MAAEIDHLVVAAADLESGGRWLAERVGVEPEPGGRHDGFGTHNLLLSLGPSAYLEVLAVDPEAAPPRRPRWFGLDDEGLRRRLKEGPVLVHWVVRVPGIPMASAAHGEVVRGARGDLRWTITVPADGSLPMGGVLPSLIQWQGESPPARLADRGLRLGHLGLATPEPALLLARLEGLGLGAAAIVVPAAEPSLHAILETPEGPAAL